MSDKKDKCNHDAALEALKELEDVMDDKHLDKHKYQVQLDKLHAALEGE